jgi:hypothetical protein
VEQEQEDAMKGTHGGQKVAPGFYWHRGEWSVATVTPTDTRLPGRAGDRYVRIPTLAMLAAAPIMGGLLVVFLPFVGFALVGREVLDWGYTRLAGLGRRRAHAKHATR